MFRRLSGNPKFASSDSRCWPSRHSAVNRFHSYNAHDRASGCEKQESSVRATKCGNAASLFAARASWSLLQ